MKKLMLMLVLVMFASVSYGQLVQFDDLGSYYKSLPDAPTLTPAEVKLLSDSAFVDYTTAKNGSLEKARIEAMVVTLLGEEDAAVAKANDYPYGELVTAAIAKNDMRNLHAWLTKTLSAGSAGSHRIPVFKVQTDYYAQIVAAIKDGTIPESIQAMWLLVNVSTESKQEVYTWLLANYDVDAIYPANPIATRINWENASQGKAITKAQAVKILTSADRSKPVDMCKNVITKDLDKLIRKKLYSDGIPFVGTEGRANVLAKLQLFTDALNAPHYNGIEALLREYDIDCPDQDRTAAYDYVAGIIPDIMIGETVPSKTDIECMQIVLGLVEYEKWRAAYNTSSPYTIPAR